MTRRYNKRKNYKSSKQYWKPRKQSGQRKGNKKRKKEASLGDILSNEAIQVFILKALAIIVLGITVIGGALFIAYRIWMHSGWSTSIKTTLTIVVLVVAGGILYGAYHLFLR